MPPTIPAPLPNALRYPTRAPKPRPKMPLLPSEPYSFKVWIRKVIGATSYYAVSDQDPDGPLYASRAGTIYGVDGLPLIDPVTDLTWQAFTGNVALYLNLSLQASGSTATIADSATSTDLYAVPAILSLPLADIDLSDGLPDWQVTRYIMGDVDLSGRIIPALMLATGVSTVEDCMVPFMQGGKLKFGYLPVAS